MVDCQLSAIDSISIVNSPLQQFDCGVQSDSIRLSLKSDIPKTIFYDLKSQVPLKNAKNIAEM